MMQVRLSAASLAAIAALSPSYVAAQSDYPIKPVRVLLGFAPGGATDILVRLMAQKLTESMGRAFVVESHPGAGGTLAYAHTARAPRDGYTLAGVSSGYSVTPVILAKLSYDPLKDLAPIALVSKSPYLIVVHPSLPVRSVRNLIDFAKAKPGALNAASAGIGSTPHLALEYFKNVAGVNITHVPYKGTGQGLIDLVSGHVQVLFGNIVSVSPQVKTGRLRALAVTAPQRSPAMPNIPNMVEAGLPQYEMTTWFGMMAPSGTPPVIINRLNAEIVKILKSPDVVEGLARDGAEPVGSAPEEFMRLIVSEIERWRKIATAAGITPQ